MPNEIARRFAGKATAVEVKRLEGRIFDNMMVDTIGGGKVRSPSRRSLTTGNASIVDFKVLFCCRLKARCHYFRMSHFVMPAHSSQSTFVRSHTAQCLHIDWEQ